MVAAASLQAQTVFDSLLNNLPPSCQSVLTNPAGFNLQIIYTRIDRDKRNQPSFINYPYKVNPKLYFYPASLVKLPAAALALEKINKLGIPGLTRSTPMTIDSSCACPVFYDRDEDAALGENRTSIEASIKRMLLVSDNGGFNRLWEFVTRDGANSRLNQCGYGNIRLLNRLAPCAPEQNAISNPLRFFGDTGTVIYSQPCMNSSVAVTNPCAPVEIGIGTMRAGTLVPRPFRADYLNYAALDDLHRFLISIIFPQTTDAKRQLALRPEDFRLLRTWMCLLPRESGIPRYQSVKNYPDSYKKYLLYGTNQRPLSPDLREFNVVGKAYGFISDVAYFADFKNRVEFFLSITMYVNNDGIINDDIYEYDTVALPFFSALTTALYEYELSRPRAYLPNLKDFLPDTASITP